MNITVLVSGSGTNLQKIIDSIESGELSHTRILKVIADRDCFALERAQNAGLVNECVTRGKGFSNRLDAAIPENTDYIVLAGFLSILSSEFCEKWAGKIINIHPSLLPKYGGKGMYGMNVHQAVIENEEKESGATVHFVTSGIDEGEILLQESFSIGEETTAEELSQQVHQVEYRILIEALKMLE